MSPTPAFQPDAVSRSLGTGSNSSLLSTKSALDDKIFTLDRELLFKESFLLTLLFAPLLCRGPCGFHICCWFSHPQSLSVKDRMWWKKRSPFWYKGAAFQDRSAMLVRLLCRCEQLDLQHSGPVVPQNSSLFGQLDLFFVFRFNLIFGAHVCK